jgi:hypothetical protein
VFVVEGGFPVVLLAGGDVVLRSLLRLDLLLGHVVHLLGERIEHRRYGHVHGHAAHRRQSVVVRVHLVLVFDVAEAVVGGVHHVRLGRGVRLHQGRNI